MIFSAYYGSPKSFYGNIQLGVWQPIPQKYGAWPDSEPASSPMLTWVEPAEKIDENIAIIKRLKAQLAETQELSARAEIRNQLQDAREEKVRAFKEAARLAKLDDDETFMLLN